jgi:hypothetical protein
MSQAASAAPSLSSVTATLQQAAAAAQLVDTLGSISLPSSSSAVTGATGSTFGNGNGPIANGGVSTTQLASGLSSAFSFLQLVQPASSLLTGSNLLSGASIGQGLSTGLPRGPSLSGGPLSGITGSVGPSLPGTNTGTDTSSVKYYTIGFAVDPSDSPSINSVDLHYQVGSSISFALLLV